MRSDFAVLILTHGRAHDQVTFHELEKRGYTGKAYLVIDDLDEQRAEYERLYGDSVIVFDKREYAKRVDTMTTEDELRSVVFARNAAYDIADDLRLSYFAMFDDDLSQFTFRYVKEGRLVSAPVTDFDALFESMVGFLETTGVTSLNIASSGALIGGLAGVYGNGMCWNINQALVVRVSDRLKFVGILNEDMNALLIGKDVGQVMLEAYAITKNSPQRGTNDGGLHSLYDDNKQYVRDFYSVIIDPSGLKVIVKRDGTSLRKSKALLYPKIVSGRWRKNGE